MTHDIISRDILQRHALWLAGLAGGAALALWQQLAFFWFTADDAYISFRYSQNFARGLGLVFNPGERVEGYTNYLWVLFGTAAIRLGLDEVAWSKIAGMILAIATVALTASLCRTYSRNGIAVLAGPLILAAAAPFNIWAVSGLETPLFTFLLTGASILILRAGDRDDARAGCLAAVVFGLAALTRPEGVLFFGVALLHAAAAQWRRGRWRPAWLAAWCACFGALVVPHLVWRWSYYGYLVPNTFFAKTGRGLGLHLAAAKYVYEYVRHTGGPLLVALPLLSVLRRGPTPHWTYLAAFVLAGVATILAVGPDMMAPFRFFVPVWPLLAALLAFGVEDLAGLVREPLATRRWLSPPTLAGGVLALICLQALPQTAFGRYPQFGEFFASYKIDYPLSASWRMAGEWLREHAPAGATVAARDIGGIGYFSGLPLIDLYGLTDATIAHAPRTPYGAWLEIADLDFVVQYLLSRRPAYIQLPAWSELSYDIGNRLYHDPRIRAEYRVVLDLGDGRVLVGRRDLVGTSDGPEQW
ncbi:MAG: glycosyltransferase family 39 protein [Chloroflexi bacterium]|nr:glycosyltransferase family 39 protein [Chloroflexota bacterium]